MNNNTWSIFWSFCYRDILVYGRRWNYYALNYMLLYPLNYLISECFIAPRVLMQSASQAELFMITLLTGNVMMIMISLSFNLLSPLLYDMEQTRTIDFIMTRLTPSLYVLQRICFAASVMSFCLLPFFVISKCLFGSHFNTSHANWPLVMLLLSVSAWMIASYTICALSLLRSTQQFGTLWIRINIPLFVLGGFWAPWHIMYKTSALLGTLTLANPMLYVTEGLRSALTNSKQFLPAYACLIALIFFSAIFYVTACRALRTKLDPVE